MIRAEEQRRDSLLKTLDPELAYNHWLFDDRPFVNELCLMLLVTLRHQVDRELIGLAARANDAGRAISIKNYHNNVERLRMGLSFDWKEIGVRLNLKSSKLYPSMETLRHLVNSYKHDHWVKPAEDLRQALDLPQVTYAPLPESDLLREQLAVSVGLGVEANYCDIADRFVDMAVDFLKEIEARATLSQIKAEVVPLNRFAY